MIDHGGVVELRTTTPHRIASATRGLSGGELNERPAADSWSVKEILARLRCCAHPPAGKEEPGARRGAPTSAAIKYPPYILTGAEYHIHHREGESFYILEGVVAFISGEKCGFEDLMLEHQDADRRVDILPDTGKLMTLGREVRHRHSRAVT